MATSRARDAASAIAEVFGAYPVDEPNPRGQYDDAWAFVLKYLRKLSDRLKAARETPEGVALMRELEEGDLAEDEYQRRAVELCERQGPLEGEDKGIVYKMAGGRARFLVRRGELTPAGALSLAELESGRISIEEHRLRCRKLGLERERTRPAERAAAKGNTP